MNQTLERAEESSMERRLRRTSIRGWLPCLPRQPSCAEALFWVTIQFWLLGIASSSELCHLNIFIQKLLVSVPDPYKTFWVLGMHDQFKRDGTIYPVGHVALHPRFKNHTIYDDFDMALVTVRKKIRFSRTVKPICLPNPNADYTGRSGIVAGWWGRLFESSASSADQYGFYEGASCMNHKNEAKLQWLPFWKKPKFEWWQHHYAREMLDD